MLTSSSFEKPKFERDLLIPAKVWDSAVSIVVVNNDNELHQHGTGTLLRVGECFFVVTAGHVAKQASEYNKALLLANPNSHISLKGAYCSDDKQDIGVIQLTKSDADKIQDKSFLQLLDIDFSTDLSGGTFGIFGYPSKLSEPGTPINNRMLLAPFQYITYAYDGTDTLENFDDNFHLLLKADKIANSDSDMNPFVIQDRQGNSLEFPKELGGISGCSVWMLDNQKVSTLDSTKKYPKIVGVQTGVYPVPKIIKATRWKWVSTLLWQAFSEIRPAIELLRV